MIAGLHDKNWIEIGYVSYKKDYRGGYRLRNEEEMLACSRVFTTELQAA